MPKNGQSVISKPFHAGLLASTYSSQSIAEYRNNAHQIFFPVDIDVPKRQDEAMVSHLISRKIGPLTATRGTYSHAYPLTGHLRGKNIDTKAPDMFVLIVLQSGRLRYAQFGREARMDAGQMILLDTRNPLRFERQTAGSALYIHIPGALLRALENSPEDFCAIPIETKKGMGAAFCDFVSSIWRERDQLDANETEVLSTNLVQLTAALWSKLPVRRSASPRTQAFANAIRYIQAHLSDPALNAKSVAKATGISRSYMHTLAQKEGKTIGQMVLSMRLERCRQALTEHRCDHERIIDIAFAWGFNDAAHFSRTFKSRFGMSPRTYRKINAGPISRMATQ